MSDIADFKGMRDQGDEFVCGLIDVAARLRTEPDYLAAVMRIESGFDPAATNPYSKATGLIQFMPGTARALGTTVDELRSMTAFEQLPIVEQFYAAHAGRIDSAGTAYMLTFLPAFARKPSDFVLGERESVEALPGTSLNKGKVYEQNSGFDRSGKGYFTVGDVKAIAESSLAGGRARGRLEVVCLTEPEQPAAEADGSAWWVFALLSLPFVWRRVFG